MLWIDAVRLGVDDVDAATADLEATYGLAAADLLGPDGRPTRVVPVGPSFLEIGLDDEVPSWSVAADDLDAHIQRLGVPAVAFTWAYRDGTQGHGRVLTPHDRTLPTIVEWVGGRHPSTCAVAHRRTPLGISSLTVGCGREPLGVWLGGDVADLPIRHLDRGVDAVEVVEVVDLAWSDHQTSLGRHRPDGDGYAL